MAVRCAPAGVMYGAYYPYLYGRGAPRSFHHAPHFQYDRFNVQAGGGNGGDYGTLSTGSGSSGAQSPAGGGGGAGGGAGGAAPSPPGAHLAPPPPRLHAKEEDLSLHGRASADGGSSESEGECGGGGGGGGCAGGGAGRAQYVSANCVVFTHYSGDVAAVVDEHFSRALSLDKAKESVPMVSRNLPASFFNAMAVGGAGGGGGGGGPCGMELYEYDPWHSAYGYGAAHRHAAEYHAAAAAHNMPYGGLLLPRAALPQYKPVEWGHAAHAHAHHAHAHAHAHAAAHAPHHAAHLDAAACSPYSYPTVPGLEAQVQDSSKDLYWF